MYSLHTYIHFLHCILFQIFALRTARCPTVITVKLFIKLSAPLRIFPHMESISDFPFPLRGPTHSSPRAVALITGAIEIFMSTYVNQNLSLFIAGIPNPEFSRALMDFKGQLAFAKSFIPINMMQFLALTSELGL